MLRAVALALLCCMPCKDPRHQVYCERFVATLDRTQSAIDAGFAVRRARRTAHELMQRDDVRDEIARLQIELARETRVRAHLVLQELAVVALSSVEHYTIDEDGYVVPVDGAPPGAMRAIARVKRKRTVTRRTNGTEEVETTTEFNLWDKNPAITNAMKHLGIISDTVQVRDATLEDMIRDAAGGEPT